MTPSPILIHSGVVIHGEKVGRKIGFPTVNIDPLPTSKIDKGVYLAECQIENQNYDCLVYFGPRLIFGEQKNCFEAYIYDFNREVYGQKISFRLLQLTRPPLPFKSLVDLQKQLEKDKLEGLSILNLKKS